jgi:hypothetical protein
MHPSTSRLGLAAVLAVHLSVLLLGGCSHQLEFGEVKGRVTLNDKALAGVIVTFYPDTTGNEAVPFARGKTDAAGNYTLATSDRQPGAVAGKHRVVVNWPLADRGENWEKPPRAPGPAIPFKYTVAADTPLIFEVKAGGPQTIDLVLRP